MENQDGGRACHSELPYLRCERRMAPVHSVFPTMNSNSDRQVVFSGGIISNVDLEVLNVRKPVKLMVLREKKKTPTPF